MRLIPSRLAARIAHRPTLARVLDNIAWLSLDKALKLGLTLFIAAWLARYLGPERFGTYNYVIALVALFTSLATFGLPTIIVRELVKEPGRRGEILGSSAVLLTVGGAVAVALALLVSGAARPGDSLVRAGLVLASTPLLLQASSVVRYWFESQIAARYLVIPENGTLLVGAAIRVLLILEQAPLIAFFWVLLVEAVLLAVLLPVVYSRMVGDLRRWRATFACCLQLMKDSWPIAMVGVATIVQARLDQVMLSRMAGDVELGYYSVALRVAESLVFFSIALQTSTFPTLVEARRQSPDEFRVKLLTFYRVTVAVALAICVPVAVLGIWLIDVVFGAAYEPAGILLALMSGRIFLAFIGSARSAYLTIENMQRHATLTVAIGTALNFVLNLFWIPDMGAMGAVYASLVSFAVTSVIADLFFSRARANALNLIHAMFTPHKLGRLS
jgi:O-antigen/teichoic acid export membrane protein